MKIQTQLKIGKLTDDFRGESVYDGKRVILDGVIPEDEAEVELNAYINGVYYGKVKRFAIKGEARVSVFLRMRQMRFAVHGLRFSEREKDKACSGRG